LSEIILTIDGVDPVDLYGEKNSRLNLVKNAFEDIKITSRGSNVKLVGEKKHTQKAKAVLEIMVRLLRENHDLTNQTVLDIIAGDNPFDTRLSNGFKGSGGVITYGRSGRPIRAKTKNQKRLVEMAELNDIVFAIGPAGTGKTYTAVALAVKALKSKVVKKIILTRPAVEAGESLGFLPGDLKDKVDPYLRPLYDALDDMIPGEKLDFFMQNRIIEVAPLAFMRGRTLDNAFIILDESQNCTTTQIRMFLTRLGPSARCIITGDPSQIDLPRNQKSGLFRALDILPQIAGIGKVQLTADDVVRHRLVKEIIKQYNVSDEQEQAAREARRIEREARDINNTIKDK
jgi:phosphate starvation-inducible PhoH-like protein